MKMINKMGLAASLVLASSLASANVYNLGDITAITTDVTVDTDTNAGVVGAFTDTFAFTLTEGNFFAALATSAVSSISSFTDISVSGTTGTTGNIFGIFSFATISGEALGQTTEVFLDAGSYNLMVSGVASASSTGYTLNTVTAVPEPSSIALMLGGLGLVGFMAARRKKA